MDDRFLEECNTEKTVTRRTTVEDMQTLRRGKWTKVM